MNKTIVALVFQESGVFTALAVFLLGLNLEITNWALHRHTTGRKS